MRDQQPTTSSQPEGRALRVPISQHVVPPAMVWPIRNMLVWINDIKGILDEPVPYSDMEAVAERLALLASHYSSSVDVLASAKWYLSAARAESFDFVWKRVKSQDPEMMRELRGVASSSNVKSYVSDRCADLIWLETTAERLNSAITHSVDALRSLLSKGKVDKQISAYSQQVRGENGY